MTTRQQQHSVLNSKSEMRTFLTLVACYISWAVSIGPLYALSPVLAVVLLIPILTLHASLSHEILHGHPFRSRILNAALVFLAVGIFVPYERFRTLHIAHHTDERLTDPYDDPESNFQDPALWAKMPRWRQQILNANNTILGRMILGPVISMMRFVISDIKGILGGKKDILIAWALHGIGVWGVVWILSHWGQIPFWAYICAAYGALSVLKIRTYLEHRAEEDYAHRTVIIEGWCPIAFLFLNNSLHAVHHTHPTMAWYDLRREYLAHKKAYLTKNGAYRFKNYAEVLRRYFLTQKDQVPHPHYKVK
ncbi:MAG: fatty acid desaturase [Halocynthiibacter sp.]